jgi:nicotinate-nucleotide adenylyltransferase
MPEAERASLGSPLGIFGGTFDPVHGAHLRLAEEAADQLGLESVRWIPAGQATHRALENKSPEVSAAQRLAMVRLAIADNPRFALDPAEAESAQPSYTVPTLERLRGAADCGARRPLVLLLGADAFAGLPTWYRWQTLFDLAHIAVAQRPGFQLDSPRLPPALADCVRQRHSDSPSALNDSPAGRIVSFSLTQLDISATQIRRLLAEGRSPRYLLPDAVIAYLQNHSLY